MSAGNVARVPRSRRVAWLASLLSALASHACAPDDVAPSKLEPQALPTTSLPAKPDLSEVAEAPLRTAIEAAYARLVREPQLLAAWVDYATLLATHDRRVEAAAAFERAEALAPQEFRWPYLQAVLLATSDVAKSLLAVERALAIDDRYSPAHVSHGKLLRDVARYAEARACFEKAAALDEKNVDAWLALGQLALESRETAAAEAPLRRALFLNPTHPEVNSALAATCFGLGRKEEAAKFAKVARDHATKVYPVDPRAALSAPPITAGDYTNAAIACMQQGRGSEAEALLTQALALDRKSAVAWGNLARLQSGRGDAAGAEQSLLEATQLAPTAATLRMLARVRNGRGKKSEAIDHLRAAVALDGDDVELSRELATLLLEVGRFEEAAAACEVVVAARPTEKEALAQFAKAMRGLAGEQRKSGAAAAAVTTLRRALVVVPTQVDLERELALLLATCVDAKVRDGAEALRLAQHAIVGNDDEPEMLDALAAAQAECGDFSAALATIRRALAMVRGVKNRVAIDLYEGRVKRYRVDQPLRLAPDGTQLPE